MNKQKLDIEEALPKQGKEAYYARMSRVGGAASQCEIWKQPTEDVVRSLDDDNGKVSWDWILQAHFLLSLGFWTLF